MEAGMQRRGGKKMKILFGVISNPQEADCVSNEMFSAMQNGNAKLNFAQENMKKLLEAQREYEAQITKVGKVLVKSNPFRK